MTLRVAVGRAETADATASVCTAAYVMADLDFTHVENRTESYIDTPTSCALAWSKTD